MKFGFRRRNLFSTFSRFLLILVIAAAVLTYYWWIKSRINELVSKNKHIRHHSINGKYESDAQVQLPLVPYNNTEQKRLCEVIHIAIVCMGNCVKMITPMIKSILHHRQNPLHFHFIVDRNSENILQVLFDTWELPDIDYSCYDATSHLEKVKWIPNQHYSGVYAFLKLLLPDILPKDINNVIVLDTDLTFMCDIIELWNMFSKLNNSQLFGLVENESDWYLAPNRWPAINRGFNTGVIILSLEKLRLVNWSYLWHKAIIDNIDTYVHTMLAEQDIFNAIIKENPSYVYNVSCQYNIQLSMKSLAKECYGGERSKVKIVHWNSPMKYNVNLTEKDYFLSVHQSYENFDGYLFRHKLNRCHKIDDDQLQNQEADECSSFRAIQMSKLRTHLFAIDYKHESIDNFDVTLVIQLSMDRLLALRRFVSHWKGPISAAIYLSDSEVSKFRNFVESFTSIMSPRSNIAYHLVFKNTDMHYPVNYLRNVALDNVNTPYVFLLDADFVTTYGLYENLKKAIQLTNPYPQKKCLVVAAFEIFRYRGIPPMRKEDLLVELANGDAKPFREKEWPHGHGATNFSHWKGAVAPYEVEWEAGFEPYFVVHRSVPRYDTRFSGYGWNKLSHAVELRVRGYRAVVLPDVFTVHTPHAPSQEIYAFRTNNNYRTCINRLTREFLEEMRLKYNVTLQ